MNWKVLYLYSSSSYYYYYYSLYPPQIFNPKLHIGFVKHTQPPVFPPTLLSRRFPPSPVCVYMSLCHVCF